jgi:hypothetical protein
MSQEASPPQKNRSSIFRERWIKMVLVSWDHHNERISFFSSPLFRYHSAFTFLLWSRCKALESYWICVTMNLVLVNQTFLI